MEPNKSDVTTKELIWEGAADWLARFTTGPIGKVTIIDSNITTMTAEADKVLKVDGPNPYLLVLEPHSYHDLTLLRRLWYRQVALDYRHNLPALTVLLLLCKEANSPGLTGSYDREMPDGWITNRYNFRVVRLWEEDPETYLSAGISLVPLAPLTKVTEADLPGLIRRMEEKIEKEPRPRPGKLWTATNVLMGLRYPKELAAQLLKGKMEAMRESTTYQAILQEGRQEGIIVGREEGITLGRIKGEQQALLLLGTKQFGPPDPATVAAIQAIQDMGRLGALLVRTVDPGIHGWDDLLREE
jgi:predicted transposase YdaD